MYRNRVEIYRLLNSLAKSKFRGSFHLRKYMIDYIDEKGMDTIKEHTISFINEKLAPAFPVNDGKQTPTKNHPTFIAMHACGMCCRSCLERIHNIPKGIELSNDEKNYIYVFLITWIENEYNKMKKEQ